MTLFEVCVDCVESALAAVEGGASRLELCASLAEDGLTPSLAFIEWAARTLAIPVMVMVRPRGGKFTYSDTEFLIMRREIDLVKAAGAAGVVSGILLPDHKIDIARTAALVQQAYPLPVTFHRAFDLTPEPFHALEELVAVGVSRILTSGQAVNAQLGLSLLSRLVEQAAGRINIMPGGGINPENIGEILARSRAGEVHFSASVVMGNSEQSTALFGPHHHRLTTAARVNQMARMGIL